MSESGSINRRDFIKTSAMLGAAAVAPNYLAAGLAPREPAATTQAAGSMVDFAAPPMERVRIGFVGVGGRGSGLLHDFMRCEGVQIKAVCDIRPERAANAQNALTK